MNRTVTVPLWGQSQRQRSSNRIPSPQSRLAVRGGGGWSPTQPLSETNSRGVNCTGRNGQGIDDG